MKGQFFANLDEDVKHEMEKPEKKHLEFLWRADEKHFGDSYELFTHVFENNGMYPKGSYLDVNPIEDIKDPFVGEKGAVDYNAPDKSIAFINYLNKMSDMYDSNHVLIPMGGPFAYENAGANFR